MTPPRVYQRLPIDEVPVKGIITRGICDHEEKTLYINPLQGDKQKLITAIHEALHYIFPKHKEKKVEADGILIGEVVWKLGYRTNENIKRHSLRRITKPDKTSKRKS